MHRQTAGHDQHDIEAHVAARILPDVWPRRPAA
jgi:hypothetical protein